MGGKKPLRRPLWPPTRATASNYYPLGLDGAGGAAKPLLRAPKKPAPLHGRLPAFSGAVDAFERARKCFLEWRYFFSIILSEFLKNRVALHFSSATVGSQRKASLRYCPGQTTTILISGFSFARSKKRAENLRRRSSALVVCRQKRCPLHIICCIALKFSFSYLES